MFNMIVWWIIQFNMLYVQSQNLIVTLKMTTALKNDIRKAVDQLKAAFECAIW